MHNISVHGKRKYVIVPYDPNWLVIFQSEVEKIRSIFGDVATAIEHIGSTAVPSLAGKPIIDILVLVDDLALAESLTPKMEASDYIPLGAYVMPDSFLFIKEVSGERILNIHIFQKEHPHVEEMLRLRNYLRTHPETVKEYTKLKMDLFSLYPNDYDSYRKRKDLWMNKLKKNL